MSTRVRNPGIYAIVLAALACSGTDEPAPSQIAEKAGVPASGGVLEGAWHVAELKTADVSAQDPASVFLFSGNHYSIAYTNSAAPRIPFAKPDAPTDAERVQAFGTIVANSGTYEVAGDTLVIRPVISKNPNYMGGGEDRFVFRAVGDTLWLVGVPGAFRWAGGQASITNQASESFKLIRNR
jgi:hypothetical protein